MAPDLKTRHWLALWVAGSLVTTGLLAYLNVATSVDQGWLGYLRLTQAGATTEATVVRTDPENHCRAEYQFTIEGHVYSGWGPECGARVGQQFLVTYLVSDPSHSCLGEAHAQFVNDVTPMVLAGVTFPLFVLVGIERRWMKRRRSGGAA